MLVLGLIIGSIAGGLVGMSLMCLVVVASERNSKSLEFTVIDKATGKYPDLKQLALKEEWAQNLIYTDMEGFCINEDGNLLLMDECGNIAYCPPERFKVIKRI
ncbi:MAG: hypothetical protein WBL14_11750 [Caldicoprobacterales bacterium]